MARRCRLTGKGRNVANNVSHAKNRNKTVQLPNLRSKRLWLESAKRFVRVRLSARALRTVTKLGLDRFMRENKLSISDIH
ncbi:MAG: 50S ribosomal protein L28 [Deltaproteobacteria bacterium]|nr:50S ribosomal protein L28 [Deltaproteobacteria bacterium]